MKIKTIMLSMLFIILLSSITTAQAPPFLEGTIGVASIIYPIDNYYKLNENLSFSVLFANSSDSVIPSDQYSCTGFFYDTNNNVLEVQNSVANGNGFDQMFHLNNSEIIGKIGTHPYQIWCNSTNPEYAYVGGYFYITPSGERPIHELNNLIFMLGIIFFSALIYYIATKIDQEHTLLNILLTFISIIMSLTAINYGFQIAINSTFIQGVFNGANIAYKVATYTLYLFSAYVVLYYIYKAFMHIYENYLR